MTEESEQPDAPNQLLAFGPVATLVLGFSLWIQVASFTLRDDVPIPESLRVLAVVPPALALLFGVLKRSPVAVIALVPLSLLPPMLLAPDGVATSLGDPWSALRVCVSLALYIALSSAWLSATGPSTTPEPIDIDRRGRRDDVSRHILVRIVPLVLWWLVPTYALFFDPAIVIALEHSYGEAARVAQLFGSMLVFFGWAIVAYVWVIVPALNIEYDSRQIVRDAHAMVLLTPGMAARRLGLTALVTVGLVGVSLLVIG